MHILQSIFKRHSRSKKQKEIYFIRDNNNNIIGTENTDLIVAKIKAMGKDDVLLIERITEKEYRDRVLLEHHFNVLGAPVL